MAVYKKGCTFSVAKIFAKKYCSLAPLVSLCCLVNILKAASKGLIDDDQNVLVGEEANKIYKTLHSSTGYIRLLCFTVFTFVKYPYQWHRFSSFLWKNEEILHKNKTDSFLCLRSKLGSDEIASRVFDNQDPPGWFKKKLIFSCEAAALHSINSLTHSLTDSLTVL